MESEQRSRWIKMLASVFFLGYSPVASGTVGTLGGVFLYLLVQNFVWMQAALILVLFFAGVRLCTEAEKAFKERDSHFIVIDEVLGFLITMFGFVHPSWLLITIGFFINRAFDICKPYPLRKLEDLRGGWGVMLDDVGAGIYSNILLRVILAVLTQTSIL